MYNMVFFMFHSYDPTLTPTLHSWAAIELPISDSHTQQLFVFQVLYRTSKNRDQVLLCLCATILIMMVLQNNYCQHHSTACPATSPI